VLSEVVIEVFGVLAVSSMVLFYALEERSPTFVALFAGACLASALYAVLIRSWPFAAVELVWSVLAYRRWRRARG
jgi:hypothetical protein